ncbi:hypothetical protein [Massilia pseudoviolaceinigra]|uniref:hypothetical protein n=1 Tax=Massilia pseudoviolaceinigra TaxID=3057165 RepID=UPI002796C02F|nr:hypothetical protein [Massilia sp. CCM 9206]MDQ1922439.1 hypothetical protein [Massilia sp. CCM 9206]
MPVYVQHEVLGKVNDVFNAETLWQAPGLALFSRRPLLRDLLERSPREHRGRAPTRCFSHITLMLAQDEVDDDRHLTRGARVRDLAQSLTALHQKDFGDLLGSDDVRYDVIGTDALEPGQVEVKFGHAVYLPAAGEQPLYTVETSRDSAVWQAVCPIYPQQRLALIGHDADLASHAVPAWPFGTVGAILLINDGPDAPIEVQVRPKGAFDCALDPLSGHYVVSAKGDSAGARLLMRVRRAGAAPIPAPSGKPAAVWKARAPAGMDTGDTAVPFSHRPAAAPIESDATYAPLAQQRVSLVGLALPCLSRYHDTGAVSMEIGLAPSLQLAADGEAAAISFSVDAADQLFALTGAGRQPIEAPAIFTPVDARAVELLAVAPAMAERYRALLRLPHPIAAPVASGARFAFGRSAPMLAALRVLDSARFLRLAGGADSASADRIGLSRSAFSFEAGPSGYQIGRLSATQALYHLDDQLVFVASIGEASSDKPYLLPSGHHLVAGHYVLRFDA